MSYTLFRFHAGWCAPCRVLKTTLQNVLPDYPNIVLKEINIDEDVEKSREYNIRSIPTLILLEDNKEIRRLVGNQDVNNVRKFLSI